MKTRPNLLTFGLLCLAWLGVSNRGFAATVGFNPPVTYTVTLPVAVVSGDFNSDGNVDLAVGSGDGYVSVLLGNGDGTFQPARNSTVGGSLISIAVADFNGDGRADLVVTVVTTGGTAIGVLLGNGDGTFGPVMNLASASNPVSVAVGDFNGDNRPDLAVACSSGAAVSVLLGNGDGTFQAHQDYASGAGTNGIAVSDLDADGKMDLITSGLGGISVRLGNGDGTFQPAIGFSVSMFTTHPLVADFNQDGKPDVAVVVCRSSAFNCDGFSVKLALGNGNGTFQVFQPVFDAGTYGVTVADLNGDGKVDIVDTTATAPATVNLRLGNGDGTFQPPMTFPAGPDPLWFATAADLNQDKAPDLVVTTSQYGNTISVLLNTTGADFSISASAPSPATPSRGQSATSSVTLNHLNAFDSPVALTCSVQPAQSASACSLNPDSVTFDASGNATATLTINTGGATTSLAPSSVRHNSRSPRFLWLPVAGFALLGTGLGSGRCGRRRLTVYLLGSILFGGLIFQTACGGGDNGPRSTTYTITITGTSGSTQHSTTVNLTIQ